MQTYVIDTSQKRVDIVPFSVFINIGKMLHICRVKNHVSWQMSSQKDSGHGVWRKACEEKRVNDEKGGKRTNERTNWKKRMRIVFLSHDVFHRIFSHAVHSMLSHDVEARRRRPIIIIISFFIF